MEVQKWLLITLHLILITKCILNYINNRESWKECKYPISTTQLTLFSTLYLTFILNLVCLLLHRYIVNPSIKFYLVLFFLFIQFANIVMCIVLSVFVGLTIHKDEECLPIKVHQLIITVITAFIYWLVVCCITSFHFTRLIIIPGVNPNDIDVPYFVEHGLSLSMIERITIETVKDDVVCSICLENIQIGTNAKVIPGCLHKFHEDCITPWLINNPICPYCRRSIVFNNFDL